MELKTKVLVGVSIVAVAGIAYFALKPKDVVLHSVVTTPAPALTGTPATKPTIVQEIVTYAEKIFASFSTPAPVSGTVGTA